MARHCVLAGMCITLRAECCIEKFRKNTTTSLIFSVENCLFFLIVPFVIGIILPNSTCVILS